LKGTPKLLYHKQIISTWPLKGAKMIMDLKIMVGNEVIKILILLIVVTMQL